MIIELWRSSTEQLGHLHTPSFLWKNTGRLCVCVRFWGREEIFTFMLKNFAQTSLQRTEF